MQWLKDVVIEYYEKIVSTFKKWYEGILETLEKWFSQTLDFIWGMVSYCINLVWDFFEYLYELFLGEDGFVWYIFDYMFFWFESAVEFFPDIGFLFGQYQGPFTFAMQLVGRMNQFFPVMESASLLAIYLMFLFLYIVIKIVLKAVPGMGG
jgi:hypothetical protein